MQPKISVLIAAYNVEKYIDECLESIVAQTYPNFEIIITDDGSTDHTLEKCRTFAAKHSNAKVYSGDNQGLSAVRNLGLKKSTGEYVVFVDGDDKIDAAYLEKLYKNLSQNHSDIAVCNFETFPIHTAVPKIKPEVLSGKEATIRLLTQQENFQIVSWNKLYKKSLFEDIRFPIGKLNEDSFTTYKILAEAKKVSFFDDILYYYRQREKSIMSSIKLNQRLNTKLAAALEAKAHFSPKSNLYRAAEISELLAYYAFLDNIFANRLKIKSTFALKWLKENKANFENNPYLTPKLRTYLALSTIFGGSPYQLFRRIKH